MESVFWSHANSYEGEYFIIKRYPRHEFSEGYHYHDYYESQIYYCEDPDEEIATISLGDETTYSLHSGDAFLINMFESHRIQIKTNKEYIRYCIAFTPKLMMYICNEKSNLYQIWNRNNAKYPLMHMPEDDFTHFLQLYTDFDLRLKMQQHGKSFLEQALLFGVMSILYNLYYPNPQDRLDNSEHMTILTNLVRYIDDHLSEDLSLNELSEITNFSTYHLCRLFKKNTGTTLNKYITSKRIENAKVLLGTNRSIQSIGFDIGFNNYNNFYRCFKQITGITPAEYRQQLSNSNS